MSLSGPTAIKHSWVQNSQTWDILKSILSTWSHPHQILSIWYTSAPFLSSYLSNENGYLFYYLWINIYFCVVCWEFIVPLENFSLIWRRNHCRQRAAILTYARHTYCDTGLQFIMVISEDPWHSHPLPTFGSEAGTSCF